jgi:WD40 repeat protein
VHGVTSAAVAGKREAHFEPTIPEETGPKAAPAARRIFVALAALMVLGVGILAWQLWERGAGKGSRAGRGAGSTAANAYLLAEHVLPGHIAPVYGVAFSPDQKFLISGSADGTVRVYEMERGSLAWTTNAGVGGINTVAVSKDSRFLAAGGGTGLAPLFDLATGRVVQTMPANDAKVYAAAFSPSQPLVASADAGGNIVLWDYQKKAEVRRWSAHPGPIRALAFAPDGQRLASGGQDSTVRLWSVADGASLKTLTSHRGMVWSIAFAPDGLTFVSTSADRTAHFWATDNYATRRVVRWGSNANLMYGVVFSPDAKFIATGAPRGVKVFKVETAARGTDRMLVAPGTLRTVAFSPDGSAVAAGGDNGLVRLWPFRGAAMFGGSAPPVTDEETAPPTNDTRTVEK